MAQAQRYIGEGRRWVVDIDLEKFFDGVNHDRLMGRLAQRLRDKAALKLIRAFLNAGVMERGLVSPVTEGTPQGGPLSPFLSNVVLDELDRELERRGHRFVRYADDCNIYVRSERAGQRVMESITGFITKRLKLNGEPGEERGSQAMESEVPGIQLHKREGAEGAYCSGGFGPMQGAAPGTDSADANGGTGGDGHGVVRLPQGMAELLRLLPNPIGAQRLGLVDTATPA